MNFRLFVDLVKEVFDGVGLRDYYGFTNWQPMNFLLVVVRDYYSFNKNASAKFKD